MSSATLAVNTLHQIEQRMRQDQGASFRQTLGRVLPHIHDAYRGEESVRGHMGASQIGNECGRAIWYGFHWAVKGAFDARILRLFNRGHLEEARFIALLLMIGCEIYQQDANGKQFRITHANGHFGGSGDGVVIGLPDLAPGTAALTEFKTHNDKSFKLLKDQGMRGSKMDHYIQMNVYMRKMGLAVGLYMAVNKNTDELYAELIPLDVEVADQYLARAEKLIEMKSPPPRLDNSPGFWKCRFCDFHSVCQLRKKPEQNCRTCAHSDPAQDGKWLCNNSQCQNEFGVEVLDLARQKKGCSFHAFREGL